MEILKKQKFNNGRIVVSFFGIKISYIDKYELLVQELENLKHKQEDDIIAIRDILNACVDIKNSPKAQGCLRKLQEADTILLAIFDLICKKYNKIYWLDYGTCLGAVRHNGFIPWDDDVDVCMPRQDYDEMRSILKKELTQYNFEINEGKGYDPCTPIIRIKYNKNSAAQIDIWPVDEYFKDTINEKEKQHLFSKIFECNNKYNQIYGQKVAEGKIDFPIEGFDKMRKEIILENHKVIPNALIFGGCECIPYGKPKLYRWDDIFPLKKILFENIYLNVPNCYEKYLEQIYGDYNKIPKSINTHADIKINKETINSDFEYFNKVLIKFKKNYKE